MEKPNSGRAQQTSRAAVAFQQKQTGRFAGAVAVVLNGDTLLITLPGAMSPAKGALVREPEDAAQAHTLHRQLLASFAREVRQEIKRIAGAAEREANAEVDTKTGNVV